MSNVREFPVSARRAAIASERLREATILWLAEAQKALSNKTFSKEAVETFVVAAAILARVAGRGRLAHELAVICAVHDIGREPATAPDNVARAELLEALLDLAKVAELPSREGDLKRC